MMLVKYFLSTATLTIFLLASFSVNANQKHFFQRIGAKMELGTKECIGEKNSEWMFAPCNSALQLKPFDTDQTSASVCIPPRAKSSRSTPSGGFTGVPGTFTGFSGPTFNVEFRGICEQDGPAGPKHTAIDDLGPGEVLGPGKFSAPERGGPGEFPAPEGE